MSEPACTPGARERDIRDVMRPCVTTVPAMPGFDPEFRSIVDYILRITYQIWEQNQPELIHRYYAQDCVIHTLSGPVVGAPAVVENTRATLAAFPDRRLYGDDVIWSDEGDGSFYTSHRITSPMTQLGSGHWGPPSGRRACVRTIADCLVRENRIIEEWLMRDGLSMALQLGLKPWSLARQQASKVREVESLQEWLHQQIVRVEQASPPPVTTRKVSPDIASSIQLLLNRLWNQRDFEAIQDVYSPVCRLHGPSGRELFGHDEISMYYRSWLAGVGDASFSVDHVAVNQAATTDGKIGAVIAVRWSLTGHYDKQGIYGAPTGARLYVLGASHFDWLDGRIVEEWSVFDELAVLAQVAGAIREAR